MTAVTGQFGGHSWVDNGDNILAMFGAHREAVGSSDQCRWLNRGKKGRDGGGGL